MKQKIVIVILAIAPSLFAQNSGWQELPDDPIAANARKDSTGIAFVDSNSVTRVHIGAYSPNPVINCKIFKRDVQVSGLTFRDSRGNETGGMGVIGDTRNSVLAFDYASREAIVIYTADDTLNPSTGIMLNQRLKPEEEIPGRSRLRIALQVENDLPTLIFLGKDGTPRISIGLDSLDNPVIQAIGKDGKTRNLLE